MKNFVPEYYINKKNKTIEVLLHEEIGMWGDESKNFVKVLKENKDNDVFVDINSPGGEVFAGFSMYSALKEHPGKVTIHVSGLAASIAALIVQSGDSRAMSNIAMMMIHRVKSRSSGDASQLRSDADAMEQMEDNIVDATQERSSLSRNDIFEMIKKTTWMKSSEALENGFIDEVVVSTKEEEESAKNLFDFNKFENYGEIPEEVLNFYDISRKSSPLMKKVTKFFQHKKPVLKGDNIDMDIKELDEKVNGINVEIADAMKELSKKQDEILAKVTTQDAVINNLRDVNVVQNTKTKEQEFSNFLSSDEIKSRIAPVSVDGHLATMKSLYALDEKNFTLDKKETTNLDNYKNTIKSFPELFTSETTHFANNGNASNDGADTEVLLEKKISEIIARDKVTYGAAYRAAIIENPELNSYVP